MSRLGAWVKGLFANSDESSTAAGLLSGVIVGGQAPRRGTRELILAYKRLPVVHSVVHRISQDVASIPLRLLRAGKANGVKRFKALGGGGSYAVTMARRAMMQDAIAAGDLIEVDSHPFLDLYSRWNPTLRGMPSRAVTLVHLELAGESFAVYERNGLGNVCEMWPVPPHWVRELPHQGFPSFRTTWLGWNRVLPEEDVLWQKHLDGDNPYARGAGTGLALADELDVDEFATRHIRNWFHNSAMPAALVAVEGASLAEVKTFQEDWEQKLKGSQKAHQLKFTNGKVNVQALSDTFKDQQLVELRKAGRDICRETFNMPPELMGILDSSNRATIEAAYFLYGMGVLCPRMDFLVSNFQPLVEEWDEGLVLDYVSPVPEDKEFKQKQFQQSPSAFTIDEHRQLGGMAPLPNGEGEELWGTDTFELEAHKGLPAVFTIDEHRDLIGLPPLPNGEGEGLFEPLRISEALTPGQDPTPPLGPDAPAADKTEPPAPAPAPAPEEDPPKKSPRGRSLRPGARKDLSVAQISRLLETLKPERLAAEVGPIWEARIDRWGNRVLDELGVDVSFDIRNPLVRQHLETLSGTKIDGITDTTREALRNEFSEAIALGEGISEIEARVSKIFEDARGYRAEMIARTEVVGSSNFANFEAFKMSGVVAQKEWLSVQDGEVRDEHAELDSTTTLLNEKFSIDGYSTNYPGGFGEAHLDINCRCSVLPVVDDAKSAGRLLHLCSSAEDRLAVWRRFDTRAASWERVALAAFRRGFRKQEADVLAALHKVA